MIIIAVTILFEYSCRKNDNSVTTPCSPADNTFFGTGIIGSGSFDAVYGGVFGATYVVYSYVSGDPDSSFIEIHLSNPLTEGVATIPFDSVVPAKPHLASVIFLKDSVYEYGIPNQNVYVDFEGSKTTITICDLLMTDANNQDTIILTARLTN